VEQLAERGLRRFTIVDGYQSVMVRWALGAAFPAEWFEYVHNAEWETTGNAYSLHLAGQALATAPPAEPEPRPAPATRAPALRAWDGPRRADASTIRRRGSRAHRRSTMARVASVDPLSATMTSKSPGCASSASSWASIVAAASKAGITTDREGGAPADPGTASASGPMASRDATRGRAGSRRWRETRRHHAGPMSGDAEKMGPRWACARLLEAPPA